MNKHNIILFIIVCTLSVLLISCSGNKPQSFEKPQKPLPDIVDVPAEPPTPMPVETPLPEPEPTPSPTPEPKPETTNILGSFKTTILDQSDSRVNNLELASEILNGTIVQPGETFSFNKAVGSRSPERGFEEAVILKQGKKDYSPGGGVCQVSSTLFNAAKEADLDIIERHSHSKDVHYLPQGSDAAVSYGSLDLKFKNNKSYPIKISTYIEDTKMVAAILKAQ